MPKTSSEKLTLDKSQWKTGSIAWNENGDIIILDPEIARKLSAKVIEDRTLEMGIPPVEVRLGAGTGDAGMPDPDGDIINPDKRIPKPPLDLCVCDRLVLKLVKINLPDVPPIPGGPVM